jgi:hypothetical protein
LSVFIKGLAICLFTVVIGLFATGLERMFWMFSGSGLVAVVPKKLYAPIADIDCDKPSIEIKRDADGVLRYRCGSYFLLSHGGRSAELSKAWPAIKPLLNR